MKKISLFLFIIAFVLNACLSPSEGNPQVTVTSEVTATLPPTQTSIPTPTLHPQFVELQERIAAFGERYRLMPDGIVYDGVNPILGLEVGRDGTILLDIGGDQVVIDQSQIHFDDDEGVTIDGYDLDEDGAWVETISEEMQQTTALIDQYGIDPETVTVTEEGRVVEVTDNETGKVLIRTNEGRPSEFNKILAIETIAKNSCEPKPEWAPSSGGNMLAQNQPDASVYFDEIMAEINFQATNGMRYLYYLIDREQRC